MINSNVDPETMHHLSQWQNVARMAIHGPIVDPPIDVKFNNDKISHLEYLKIKH